MNTHIDATAEELFAHVEELKRLGLGPDDKFRQLSGAIGHLWAGGDEVAPATQAKFDEIEAWWCRIRSPDADARERAAALPVVNLTPHDIRVLDNAGRPTHIFESRGVARAEVAASQVCEIGGVPIQQVIFGSVDGLPAPAPDQPSWYIVSAITRDAAARAGRATDDLLTPYDVVRDDGGVIVGCRALALATAAIAA